MRLLLVVFILLVGCRTTPEEKCAQYYDAETGPWYDCVERGKMARKIKQIRTQQLLNSFK